MKHDLEVTIDQNGNIEFHAKGIAGKGCLAILGEFEKALGMRTGEPTATPEMNEKPVGTGQKAGQ